MPEFPNTDYYLIESVKNSENGAAWSEFITTYEPVVLKLCQNRGLQDADARDVAQQVFLSVARAISGWHPSESGPPFRAWITRVVRNAISDKFSRRPRDRATGSTSVADLLARQPENDDASAAFDAAAKHRLVLLAAEKIRDELPAAAWEVFRQTTLEGIPISEVAHRTGRSTGSIYVIRHRAIARLKERVHQLSATWGFD